jgi:hypothetical protein
MRRLKESPQEGCRFIRNADDLIRRLAIEFEIEFRLGAIVVPVAKLFQLAAPERPLGGRSAANTDADPRRLAGGPAFLRNCFGRSNYAAGNQASPAFVLTRKDKDQITLCDVLPTVHCLLSGEREGSRPRIGNRRLDRERHLRKRH